MNANLRPLQTGIYQLPDVDSLPIHAMHPRGGSLPAAAVADLIRSGTKAGDVVLDPFGGYGTTAIEALRLGRRAVTTDPNPLASFFTEVVFSPASLPQLQWAFQDLSTACRDAISELFATACPQCGKKGIAHFLHRENGRLVRLDYTCACTPGRLSKKPDAGDRRMEVENADADIPFWHPTRLPLNADSDIRTDYPADFLRRRTVAALSILLNSINNITEPTVRDAMKLAFASALGPCHCSTPFPSRETARGKPPMGQRTLRPRGTQRCTVANPWDAFSESFRKVYEGKKAGNTVLRNVTIGYGYGELESRQANVVILGKSAEDALICELPENSVDFVLTEPPFGLGENDSFLPAIQAAWLKMEFDRNREIVFAPDDNGSVDRYRNRMEIIARGLCRVVRDGGAVDLFCADTGGSFFPEFLSILASGGLAAEVIRYQPAATPPYSRGGGYIVRAPVRKKQTVAAAQVPPARLAEKADAAARELFGVYGKKITADKILHSFYQRLDRDEIAALHKSPPEKLLGPAVASFAQYRKGRLILRKANRGAAGKPKIPEAWRQMVLEAESLATGGPGDAALVRGLAVQRLAGGGLTADDANAIRQTIPSAEIARHRRTRTVALLRAWGSALGYQIRVSKKKPTGITWKTPAERIVDFTPGEENIRITHHLPNGAISEWGAISYLELERAMGQWCRNHPTPGDDLSRKLSLIENIREPQCADPWESSSPTRDLKLRVAQNRKICEGHYLIQLELPADVPITFHPGQFFHVLCDPGNGKPRPIPLTLRRPLSIHRAEYPHFHRAALARAGDLPDELRRAFVRHPARIDFLYRVVGEGTDLLSRARKGALLRAIGPCGNGFAIGPARTAVIVAGGIGVAPLAALAERLRERGKEVLIYLGAVKKEMLSLAVGPARRIPELEGVESDQDLYDAIHSEFDEIGARVLTVCTDDGSLGEKGLVTEMLARGLRDGCVPRESVCVYACGPEGMLRAVAEIAARNSLDCQVTLETRMACAVGACYSCTTRVIEPDGKIHRKRVCRDGPVFEARDIQWKD